MKLLERLLSPFRRKPRFLRGVFKVQIFNADGSFDREFEMENADTTAGLNNILDVYFNAATQITTWYLGLIDNAGFTAVAATDTMAAHGGWVESIAYAEAARPTWTSGAASGAAITNAVSVNFTLNATTTIRGIFVTSNNTKSGTTGILLATALRTVETFTSGQVAKMTYTKTATAT